MRTILLLATAATAAWWADGASAQHRNAEVRTERRVIVVNPQHANNDGAVYVNGDDRMLTEGDYRGRWVEGEWTPDRRRFEGVYEVDANAPRNGPQRARHSGGHNGGGADYDRDYDRDDHARYDGPPPMRDGGRYADDDMMRRCRRDNGVGGAAIGGIAGGVIGNRVAGRGDRRIGTVVGAVAGAAVGAAVDRGEDRRACDAWYRDYESRSRYAQQDVNYRGGYQGGEYAGYDSGYSYGGGMQTIVIPGQPVIIEETETYYEDVVVATARPRVRHRAAPRRVVRARPRPRCVCR